MALRVRSKVPSSTHSEKARWQVWYGGNFFGKSLADEIPFGKKLGVDVGTLARWESRKKELKGRYLKVVELFLEDLFAKISIKRSLISLCLPILT